MGQVDAAGSLHEGSSAAQSRVQRALQHPSVMRWVGLAGAVLIGILTAVQARINGALGIELGDGLLAALISMILALVVMIVLSLVVPNGRRGARALYSGLRKRTIPWWMVAGGAAGALTVATQGLTVAVIGVALFSVGVVAGQTVNGLVLDRVGYGPAGVVAITPGRLMGAVIALAAVALSISPEVLATVPIWMLVLPVLTGAGIAWQQATNGRLRHRTGSALTATLVNFIGGTILLAIAVAINISIVGWPVTFPTEPWLYVGGLAGMVYVLLSASLVRFTGMLLLGLAAIVGQLTASVLIDIWWPATSGAGPWQALAMVVLALMAVAAAAIPWGRVPWRRLLRRAK